MNICKKKITFGLVNIIIHYIDWTFGNTKINHNHNKQYYSTLNICILLNSYCCFRFINTCTCSIKFVCIVNIIWVRRKHILNYNKITQQIPISVLSYNLFTYNNPIYM